MTQAAALAESATAIRRIACTSGKLPIAAGAARDRRRDAAVRLPARSVGAMQLKPNAVSTAKIKPRAVTADRIAAGAVDSAAVRGGSLRAGHFAGGQPGAGPKGNTGAAGPAGPARSPGQAGSPGEAGQQGPAGSVATLARMDAIPNTFDQALTYGSPSGDVDGEHRRGRRLDAVAERRAEGIRSLR